ncbi:MAG: hypothetical protein HOF58_09710 [Candidatus Marinimicrobia bacterium]|nr:hypothetical protein [Candidatus Neomarinimicrobiota bacterium]MBT4369737.1 hypothetical protein [Candidatus Neomarinimicrobiota bacterium]MDC1038295.1 type II toxin-antitoxin system RelE/ParE family toxin [Candidatus Neomarinimicrobiota bacterium]
MILSLRFNFKKSKRFKRRHPSLRLHRLKGELKDLHSVSINLQYRITLHFIIKDDLIIPVDVGSRDEIY